MSASLSALKHSFKVQKNEKASCLIQVGSAATVIESCFLDETVLQRCSGSAHRCGQAGRLTFVNCESPSNPPIVTNFKFQTLETLCAKHQRPDPIRGEAGSFPSFSPTFASFHTEMAELGCVQAVLNAPRRLDWPKNTHVFWVSAEDQVVAFVLLQGNFEPDVRKEGVTVDPLQKRKERCQKAQWLAARG